MYWDRVAGCLAVLEEQEGCSSKTDWVGGLLFAVSCRKPRLAFSEKQAGQKLFGLARFGIRNSRLQETAAVCCRKQRGIYIRRF
jgi:hypothetical protein